MALITGIGEDHQPVQVNVPDVAPPQPGVVPSAGDESGHTPPVIPTKPPVSSGPPGSGSVSVGADTSGHTSSHSDESAVVGSGMATVQATGHSEGSTAVGSGTSTGHATSGHSGGSTGSGSGISTGQTTSGHSEGSTTTQGVVGQSSHSESGTSTTQTTGEATTGHSDRSVDDAPITWASSSGDMDSSFTFFTPLLGGGETDHDLITFASDGVADGGTGHGVTFDDAWQPIVWADAQSTDGAPPIDGAVDGDFFIASFITDLFHWDFLSL